LSISRQNRPGAGSKIQTRLALSPKVEVAAFTSSEVMMRRSWQKTELWLWDEEKILGLLEVVGFGQDFQSLAMPSVKREYFLKKQ
jgi:hypothetical protein